MKIVFIAILMLTMQVSFADDHRHHSAHTKKTPIHQDQKKRFKPTDDLKVRMEKILALTKELKDKKGNRKLVGEYSDQVAAVVNDIFKTCKLDPEADAAVHPVLGRILEGAEELKKEKYESGHSKIHEALLNYEKSFSHEGWRH